MKRSMLAAILAIVCLLYLFSPATGVDLKKSSKVSVATPLSSEEDLYIKVDIVQGRGKVFRTSENVNISFAVSKDAYVVIYNIDAEGYVHLLFPQDGNPVRCDGRKTYFLPEPGSGTFWQTGSSAGIEYIHAIAVEESGLLDEDELYFLASGERISREKRFRIDDDPFLAFNLIDKEIVRDAARNLKATGYTFFYIEKRVEYPRYICSKCHSPGKLSDPYAQECPEVVIERISHSEEPSYPYPPLYDIHYANEAYEEEEKVSSSEEYREEERRDDETRIYLFGFYGYPWYPWSFYRSYYGIWDPFPIWDPFWGGFSWSIWWGDPWFWPYSYGYFWNYGCYSCWRPCWYCREYRGYLWNPAAYRRVYGDRNIVKRTLDYGTTYSKLVRERSLMDSKLAREKMLASTERARRSDLGRMASEKSLITRNKERASDLGGRARESLRAPSRKNERIDAGGVRRIESTDRFIDRKSSPTRAREKASGGKQRTAGERGTMRSAVPSRDTRGQDRKVPPSRPVEKGEAKERSKETDSNGKSDQRRTSESNYIRSIYENQNARMPERVQPRSSESSARSSSMPYRGASSGTSGSRKTTRK